MNPLQRLIRERLDTLDISQRAAAERSQGLLTAATLNRILTGKHHLITARAVAGLALALDVPESVVAQAARETAFPAQWVELSEQFGALSPEDQDLMLRNLADALDRTKRKQVEALEAERPNRKRRTGRASSGY